MYTLTLADAIHLVRCNFDEQEINGSQMIGNADTSNFDSLAATLLPDAINHIHAAAPVDMLDGISLSEADANSASIKSGVLTFSISDDLLRVVAFRADDSDYVVSSTVPEYSAEGRMQLNPYTMGTSTRPRLVVKQGKTGEDKTSFAYYSLSKAYATAAEAISTFKYLPLYRKADSYEVADNVVENIIDYLTGMMMGVYENMEGAQYFFSKASFGGSSVTNSGNNS